MKRTIKAVIPVRGGSKRVVDKNIRPFAGTSLLELKIAQLLQVPELAGICINSDDDRMLEIARKAGVEAVRRDPHYASDSIPMSEVYAHMASSVETDDLLYATVTTPLIGPAKYRKAVDLYFQSAREFDSLHSAVDVKEFLLRDGQPLNYDPNHFPRSQDLPDIVRLVFGFAILPRDVMIRRKSSLGERPQLLKVTQSESVDIDTPHDFEVAEFLYNQQKKAEQERSNGPSQA